MIRSLIPQLIIVEAFHTPKFLKLISSNLVYDDFVIMTACDYSLLGTKRKTQSTTRGNWRSDNFKKNIILLMEEILQPPWMYKTLYIMGYLPYQLVSRISSINSILDWWVCGRVFPQIFAKKAHPKDKGNVMPQALSFAMVPKKEGRGGLENASHVM